MRQFFLTRNLLLALALTWLATAAAQAQFAVTALSPARNAKAAPRPTNVGITFNQSVNAARAGNVRVFSAQRGGQLVRGGNATASGSTITVNPASDLQPGETVFVTVPATVTSAGATAATPHVYQFTAAAGTATGTFDGGTDPYVNVSPNSVVVGDIDGDGDLDLLTANLIGSVNIRLNNGMGVFSGNTGVAVGATTASVALGDLDGDGDLDLVTADYSGNTASVRLNNGAVGFNTGSNPGVGTNPTSVAVGDVDGDGDLDLLTANYSSNTVSVRLNNGAGAFSGGSDPSVGIRPQGVAVGDVDGDGDLDLLTTNSGTTGTLSVRLNNGAGGFGGGSVLSLGGRPNSVALGDLDGDGDLDLLTANGIGSSTASVRFNNGAGTFSGGSDPSVGIYPQSVAVGDVDGDGDLDLLTANSGDGTVSVRLNQSAPTATTATPASITGTSAVLGGTVASTSSTAITERGVVYVAGTGTPTTANTKVAMGSGTGSFAQAVTGLAAGTTYAVRAYAINSVGIGYGPVLSFTTPGVLAVGTGTQPAYVLLYPNPAGTRCTLVRPAATAATAELLNALGQVVRRFILPTVETTLDLRGLVPGVYQLRFPLNGQPTSKRLLIE